MAVSVVPRMHELACTTTVYFIDGEGVIGERDAELAIINRLNDLMGMFPSNSFHDRTFYHLIQQFSGLGQDCNGR
jgi:hypothetical protein